MGHSVVLTPVVYSPYRHLQTPQRQIIYHAYTQACRDDEAVKLGTQTFLSQSKVGGSGQRLMRDDPTFIDFLHLAGAGV